MPENAPGGGAPAPCNGVVLVVDDELAIVRVYQKALAAQGYHVFTAGDGSIAEEMFRRVRPHCVVSDLTMPGVNGLYLLRTMRAIDPDVPVIIVTGEHDERLMMQAAEEAAHGFFNKPLDLKALAQMVAHATRLNKVAAARRASARAQLLAEPAPPATEAGLAARFERALATVWVAFQPVVCWAPSTLIGFEALAHSEEPTLADATALFAAAERLGRMKELGRAVRSRVAAAIPLAPETAWISLDVHAADLLDEDLYTESAPLRPYSDRMLFEVSEREPLDGVDNLEGRIVRLRHRRYRLALDDLGATHVGLASLARLKPSMVKIDASLIRGIDQTPMQEAIVRALVTLTKNMGVVLVADGVESAEEAQALGLLGCTFHQGSYYGRPARSFR